jgi:twitching motility protein PilT
MIHIIDYLIQTRELGGSDLHLAVGAPPAARVNGALQPLESENLTPLSCKDLIYGVLTDSQRSQLEDKWDLDFAVQVENVGRFRGNAHYSRGMVEATFRYVPKEIPELSSLGHGRAVTEMAMRRSGLVLVTGMAGQGKTTTLAAMTQRVLAERSCVIVSIEDPIEYVFDHSFGLIKQREIGSDSKSFAIALRAALRQDPDIILISELRDRETISTALTAAETGHLVIATMHAMDAAKAIDRLVDVFPHDQQGQIRSQISTALAGVISQVLLPRLDLPGRVLATEVMINNSAIGAIIREGRNERLISQIQIGAKDNMHTLDDSLTHLLINGHISFEDAQQHAREKDYVAGNFQAHLQAQAASATKRK